MTQRNAILTRTLSVAFLIPACLSFAQVPEPTGTDTFQIRMIRQQLKSTP